MTSRLFLASLAWLAFAAPGASVPLTLSPCTPPGTHEPARCGTLTVPEDRAHPAGRKIGLHVVVLPAVGTPVAADAVTYFAGGPGGAASEEGLLLLHDTELREHRQIVLVDARGTGQSNPLNCPNLQGDASVQGSLDGFMPVAGVRACSEQLVGRADVRFYTTAPAVDDVDDVRAALGIEKLDLIGGSYGTRAALKYIRRHGARVRSAVLLGVFPPGTKAPLSFARDAQGALDGLFARCRADSGCNGAFPRLGDEFAAVLNRLATGPVAVAVTSRATGKTLPLRLGAAGFAQAVRYMLYVPTTAALLPLYIHRAAAGDFVPLATTMVGFAAAGSDSSDGFYLSVTCPEEVRKIDSADVPLATAGTFLGDFRVRQQQAACAVWPPAETPAALDAAVRSEVPALLINGQLDPVTPVYRAEQALRTLPQGHLIVVPGGAHTLASMRHSECFDQIFTRFINAGSAKQLDESCLSTVTPPPFLLALSADITVHLSVSELQALAGTYRNATRLLKVFVDGDHLVIDSGDHKVVLLPMSSRRFRIEGMPRGFTVTFKAPPRKPRRLVVEEGVSQKEEYQESP